MSEIKVYAEDSLFDLFKVINRWNNERVYSVTISLQDLTLMKNHIEDLELEVYGYQELEAINTKTIPNLKSNQIIKTTQPCKYSS